MTDYETQKLFDTPPTEGVLLDNYNTKVLFYNGETYHQEVENLSKKISALIDERKKLINNIVDKIQKPTGWSVAFHEKESSLDYGKIKYSIRKEIYEERPAAPPKPVAPPTPPKKLTRLEIMLSIMDSKTLFNSGILDKEEKAELLKEYMEARTNA